MEFIESLKGALKSLKGNKVRSFLTMLGIIIGITSVITMSAIGQGAQKNITGDLKSSGYGKFKIYVDKTDENFRYKYMLTDEIINDIRKNSSVKRVSPNISGRFFVKIKNRNEMIWANITTRDYEEIEKVDIIHGRNIVDFEYDLGEKVVTIDNLTAKNLFEKEEEAIGKTIELINGREGKSISYKIVGVFKNPMESIAKVMGGRRIPRYLRLPLSTYDKIFSKDIGNYSEIIIEVREPEKMADTMKKVRNDLNQLTGMELYEIQTISSAAESFDKILSSLNMFVSFVAGISLFVGGIGVMNIMLVSVIERTKEIGIRKAIGATNKDILEQFLIESIILTGFGGIIGIILGFIFGIVIGKIVGIPPVFLPIYIFGSIVTSMFIGIIFGVAPAKKAANLNPIDALRSE